MDIQNRVVNYYKNNQFIQKYLKGIDQKTNEVVLTYNNDNKRISIEKLEKINSEESLIEFLEGKTEIKDNNESFSSAVAPTIEATPIPLEQSKLTSPEYLSESLNDIKLLTELKNKDGLDNLFKKIAINPNTGLIDINSAIQKVTRNTINEVKNAVINNYEFNNDLLLYGLDGKYNGKLIEGTSTVDEKIIRSFNNIKVILEASKMYPEQANYNDEQINLFLKTYINKVKEELNINNKMNNSSLNTPNSNEVNEIKEVPLSPNAGFADIFVLTVIVLVYAAIIVNLILKLS